MGRAPRANVAGSICHVTARGIRRSPIFEDERDFERFKAILIVLAVELEWRCHSYCLMPNHFHLEIETVQANLSAGMQRLNWRYASWFNWTRGYQGHLFERRFWCEMIDGEAQFLECARYIVLNPVRAGLCRHPGMWRHSSYLGTVGRLADPLLDRSRLLGRFSGVDEVQAVDRYRRFVADGVASGRVSVPGTETRPDQPKPYVPAKRVASRRTRRPAGRPTTLR